MPCGCMCVCVGGGGGCGCMRACVRVCFCLVLSGLVLSVCLSVCLSICMSTCLSACLSVSHSQAIPRKRLMKVIIIKIGTVTISDMGMHNLLTIIIILTLTFIQGRTYLNNVTVNIRLFQKRFQAMPIKFALKIVRLKVYILILASPMALTFPQGHNCVSNFTNLNL